MLEILKASNEDAEILLKIQIESFNEHAKKWGSWTNSSNNNGPGGYDSLHHVLYSIKATHFYKVVYENDIIGGISVLTSKKNGFIDKFFIHPDWKNKGFGSCVIELIEKEYPTICRWELGTSSKSVQNHRFYEKVGYNKIGEDENYFYFEKKKEDEAVYREVFENQILSESLFFKNDMSKVEMVKCKLEQVDFNSVNMKQSSFSSTNISEVTFHDVNMTKSKFHNCNLNETIFGDINLNKIEICQAAIGGAYIHDTNLGWHENYGPIKFERCILTNSTMNDCNLSGVEISNCEMNGMKINGIPVEELLKAYELQRRGD